jgi:hypothetical protein
MLRMNQWVLKREVRDEELQVPKEVALLKCITYPKG